jgi:hypothetical protein
MSATGQAVFTVGVTIPWVIAVALAIRSLVKHGSPALGLFLVGGALCTFWEPVVDVLGMCFFPRTNQWVGLEVFGRPIPLFMWPVYSWFVGGQAYLFWRAFQNGISARTIWRAWLAICLVNVVLETPGLLMNVYTYYGDQPFNPWGLPLWWPPVNATMPLVAGFVIYQVWPHLIGWRKLAVVALLPMADGMANAATALPVWTTLNTQLGKAATYPAAVVTAGLAALVVWCITTTVSRREVASTHLELRVPEQVGA